MKLFYAVNCGNDCGYYPKENVKEEWKHAELYGEPLQGYKVSNFGGITKNGENVSRVLDIEGIVKEGEIYVNIEEKGNVLLYIIDLFDNPLFTPWIFKINNTADKRHS